MSIEPKNTQPLRIGYCLSLTGPVAGNSRSARLAHEIWRDGINRRGASLVDRSSWSAMPVISARKRFFVGLMGLGVNNGIGYPGYFAMIPTGPNPDRALTEGFFELASAQHPRPTTVALIAADAEFSRNPLIGARQNAATHGFDVVFERNYPLSTTDFAPLLEDVASVAPDLLFICSYLSDSIALVRAINEWDYAPKMIGASMIGPQSASVKTALGPLLNGIVNYEYWLPVSRMMFEGVRDFMEEYQSRAVSASVDPLGYYMAPQAFAQLQVLEQAVTATGSLDDATLIDNTRKANFRTVVGNVKFGRNGEWTHPRVVQVQFQNIASHDLAEFKKPGRQVVVAPGEFASGDLIYPYERARQSF